MRVLAVGDVHTKLWIVDRVREMAEDYDRVIFVGDFADDWDKEPIDTINTWKELRSLSHSNPNVKLVQGNHDYIYTNYTKTTSGGYSMGTQFLLDLPDNKGLKEWLHNLPIILEIDKVKYSHAGITESWNGGLDPVTLWRDDSPIWARPTEEPYPTEYRSYPQVFGHTPSPTCWEVQPDVWCIDTFSTYQDGTPIGDETVLEVIDGRKFNKIKLKK
jgi:hypothetical protein